MRELRNVPNEIAIGDRGEREREGGAEIEDIDEQSARTT